MAKLGITAPPASQQKLIKLLYHQLFNWSVDQSHPQEVTAELKHMLLEIEEAIDAEKTAEDVANSKRNLTATSSRTLNEGLDNNLVIEAHRKAKEVYDALPRSELENLMGIVGELPQHHLLGKTDDMFALLSNTTSSESMTKAVNHAFLLLVQGRYWTMLGDGDLRPGSEEASVLLTSVRFALSPITSDLRDYRFVNKNLPKPVEIDSDWWNMFAEGGDDPNIADVTSSMSMWGIGQKRKPTCLSRTVKSASFQITIALSILFCCMYVAVEEAFRHCSDTSVFWLVIETFFSLIFLVEAIIKIADLECRYFRDLANSFDFFLVLLGIFGVILAVLALAEDSDPCDTSGNETRLVRFARVFRVLRFLRVFRLLNAQVHKDKDVSVRLSSRMKTMTIFMYFIIAQLVSQTELLKYFGGNGKLDEDDEKELARCIVQSQTSVYKALNEIVIRGRDIDEELLKELKWTNERKDITENLERFVLDAHKAGAINAVEAEGILHPLHHQIRDCIKRIKLLGEGVNISTSSRHSDGKHGEAHNDSVAIKVPKPDPVESPPASVQGPVIASGSPEASLGVEDGVLPPNCVGDPAA